MNLLNFGFNFTTRGEDKATQAFNNLGAASSRVERGWSNFLYTSSQLTGNVAIMTKGISGLAFGMGVQLVKGIGEAIKSFSEIDQKVRLLSTLVDQGTLNQIAMAGGWKDTTASMETMAARVTEAGVAVNNTTLSWARQAKSAAEANLVAVENLTNQFKEISISYGQELANVAQGAQDAVSAGVNAKFITGFMDITAKMAVASGSSIDVATNAMINLGNAYSTNYGDTKRLKEMSDQFFIAMNYGKASMEDLARVISKASPTAAMLKVNTDALLASGAALTLTGQTAALSFTNLNATMVAFVKPTSGAEKSLKSLATAGFGSFETGLKAFEKTNFVDYLLNLRAAADKTGTSYAKFMTQTNTLSTFAVLTAGAEKVRAKFKNMDEMFTSLKSNLAEGKSIDQWSEKMLSGVDAVTTAWLRQMLEMRLASEAPGVATQIAFDKVRGGLKFNIDQMKASWSAFVHDFIQLIEPVVSVVVQIFATLGQALHGIMSFVRDTFGSFRSGIRDTLTHIHWFKDAFKVFTDPIKINMNDEKVQALRQQFGEMSEDELKKVYDQVYGISDRMEGLQGIIGLGGVEFVKFGQKAAGAWIAFKEAAGIALKLSQNISAEQMELLKVNPLGKMMLAVRERLIMLRDTISDAWQAFKDTGALSKVLDTVVNFFQMLWMRIMVLGRVILAPFNALKDETVSLGTAIGQFFGNTLGYVLDIFNAAIDAFSSILEGIAKGVEALFSAVDVEAFQSAIDGIQGFVDAMGNSLRAMGEAVGGILAITGEALAPLFDGAVAIFDFLVGLFTDIANGISSLFDGIRQGWEEYVVGPISNFANMFKRVIDRVLGVFQSFKDAASNAFDFREIGGQIASIFGTIVDLVTAVIGTVVDMAMSLYEGIAEFFDPIMEAFSEVWYSITGIINSIGGLFTDILGGAEDAADGTSLLADAFNFVGQVIGAVLTAVAYVVQVIVMLVDGLVFGIANIGTIFTAVGSTIGDFFNFLGNMIGGAMVQMAAWAVGSVSAVLGFVEAALGFFVFLWGNIQAGLGVVGNFFIDVWNSIAETVIVPFINFFIDAYNTVGVALTDVFNFIGETFQSVWNFMANDVLAPVINFFIDAANAIGEAFFAVWQGTKTAFFSVASAIVGGIETMINTVLDGINAILEVYNSVASLAGLDVATIGKVDFGAADLSAAASSAGAESFKGMEHISGADLGAGEFQKAVFQAADRLDGSSLNITERFDDATMSWADAQSQAAGSLGSDVVQGLADELGKQSDAMFQTPIMQEGAWDDVASAWDRAHGAISMGSKDVEKSADSTAESMEKGVKSFEDYRGGVELASGATDDAEAAGKKEEEQAGAPPGGGVPGGKAAKGKAERDKAKEDRAKAIDFSIALNDAECGERRAQKRISEQIDSQFTKWACDVVLSSAG